MLWITHIASFCEDIVILKYVSLFEAVGTGTVVTAKPLSLCEQLVATQQQIKQYTSDA